MPVLEQCDMSAGTPVQTGDGKGIREKYEVQIAEYEAASCSAEDVMGRVAVQMRAMMESELQNLDVV
jgi:hypothetical protein